MRILDRADAPSAPSERYVRPPQQERSRQSMERILDAGAGLLADGGWSTFTVEGVSRQAGVATASIYQRFGSKEGLFGAIHDRHLIDFAHAVDDAFDLAVLPSAPPADGVREVITRLGELFETHGELGGVCMLNSHRVPEHGAYGAYVMAAVKDAVVAALLHYLPEDAGVRRSLGREDRAAICYRMAHSTYADYATFHRAPEQRREVGWDTLRREVAAACSAYLLSAPL
ncbi:MAG: helix-turn-helix domain-containing protein [Nocardioides sp.]|uniref:TetR/AcrR family transcriptional regulator n=1 Tax=Nocardioides sp. TaxID=35761 RepID=UPI0039E3821C